MLFLAGVVNQQWQVVLWSFVASWCVTAIQMGCRQLESPDKELREWLDAAQASAPTIIMGTYFCLQHDLVRGVGLYACILTTPLIMRMLRRLERRSQHLRLYAAWGWIILWQGGLAVLLVEMAF